MSFNPLSMLELFTLLLSVYVLAESVPAICHMPGQYQMFCHKAKYVVSFASALAVAYVVFQRLDVLTQWVLFGLMGNISLFVWPRTLWRFRHALNSLELFLMDPEVHDEN